MNTTSPNTPLPNLPPRDPNAHKGTFGTVAVIGACARKRSLQPQQADPATLHMLGGPCFTALAALRSGCGLAKLILPEPLVNHALTIAPSATALGIPTDNDGDIIPHHAAAIIDSIINESACLAVGPGLGVSPGAAAAVLRTIIQDTTPLVLDADALNILAQTPDLNADFRAPAILTPHPGEFNRLAQSLNLTHDPDNQATRAAAAEALAQRLGAVVILKAAATIVTDGQQTWTHDHPNPALATAGTGDVLTGITAALVAQFAKDPAAPSAFTKASGGGLFDAARLAVTIHANAAKLWCQANQNTTSGLTAPDLLHHIPAAAEALRTGTPP